MIVAMLVAAVILASSATASPTAFVCSPTLTDGNGPFGRAAPPVRAKIGTGHVLTGVVVSALDCEPIRGARVQIWQANAKGIYTRATSATVITDRTGRFRFQGPRPPGYEGRPGHIHLRIVDGDHLPLLTRYEPRSGSARGNLRFVLEPDAL